MLFCGSPISESDSEFKSVHQTSSSEGNSDNGSSNSSDNNNELGNTPSKGDSDAKQENLSSAGDVPNSKKENDASSKKGSNDNKEDESSENESNSKKDEKSSSKEDSSSEEQNGGSKEPLKADNGVSNIGLAVFKGDKLVGELTPRETLSNLIISNELKSCRLSITDPDDSSKVIDMLLTEDTKPKIKVSILNGTPYVTVKVNMNSRISSITNISEPVTDERISKIELAASQDLKSHILGYLYRTSKEFKSDISGIGKYAISNFKTYSEFVDYNWLEKYEDAFFSVETDVSIKSSFLLTGS